jgi:hypothetical protein
VTGASLSTAGSGFALLKGTHSRARRAMTRRERSSQAGVANASCLAQT